MAFSERGSSSKQRPNDGRGFLARKPLRGSSFLAPLAAFHFDRSR